MAKKTKEDEAPKKVASKKETPAKKTAAKKVVVAKVPTKKAAPKKAAAKKEAVKKVAVKKEAPKKVAAKKVEEKVIVDVSDVKWTSIGKKFNIKVEGKTKTVNLDEAKLENLKIDIEKYNSMSEKVRATSTGQKLKKSIFETALSESMAEKKSVDDKKSELKVTKKKLENKIKKEEKKEEAKVTDIAVTEQQAAKVEEELARHLRYIGYKHPVTGKTWNGERYV